MKYSIKDIIVSGSSELCSILGAFYEEKADYSEACIWYYNARYETKPEICLIYQWDIPLAGLVRCYKALGDEETAESYRKELDNMG